MSNTFVSYFYDVSALVICGLCIAIAAVSWDLIVDARDWFAVLFLVAIGIITLTCRSVAAVRMVTQEDWMS